MIDLRLGDCLEVMRSIPDGSVDAVVTDIPYDEANRDSNGLRNLDKQAADVLTFGLAAFLQEIDRVCRGSFYVFCGFQQLSEVDRYFRQNGISRRCIVWEKTNPSPMNGQRIWLSGVELCVYGKKPRATYNAFCRNTVLRYPNGASKVHPTEKSLPLMTDLVLTSTNERDVILDPCMGSGTTGVACVNTGRNFIGIERDVGYYQIATERIQKAQEAGRQLTLVEVAA